MREILISLGTVLGLLATAMIIVYFRQIKNKLLQFLKSGRTNSVGPGGGTVSHSTELLHRALDDLDGLHSKALAELIERVDEKLLKQLLLNRIKAGVTSDQYMFFWKISTAYLEVLKCQSEFRQKEKLTKLQWIGRG